MDSPSVTDSGDPPKRKNASTVGATTAVSRSFLTYIGQLFAFYIRHPVKLFRPSSLDYTFAAKAINPAIKAGTAPLYKTFAPYVLASAVKNHGWSFVGNQVVPPFLANMTIGVVLYTTYMAALPYFTGGHEVEKVYPPPPFRGVFAAGATAGAAQSLVSTPLLTLQAHFTSISAPAQSLWSFTYTTIKQLGLKSTYSPLRISLIKESLSYGLFFGVFEYVKQQGYYKFLDYYYGGHRPVSPTGLISANERKPHWALSPAFVLLAGSTASIAYSAVSFPLQKIQQTRFKVPTSYRQFLSAPSLVRVYTPSLVQVVRRGGLYRGFLGHAVRMIPSSSVALIVFEGVRRGFAPGGEGIWGGDVVVPI